MAFIKKTVVNIVKIDSIDVVLMIKWTIQCVVSSLKSHTMRKLHTVDTFVKAYNY
jgi:hypothetical protein